MRTGLCCSGCPETNTQKNKPPKASEEAIVLGAHREFMARRQVVPEERWISSFNVGRCPEP